MQYVEFQNTVVIFGLDPYPIAGRFYGFTENSREVEMDMREMVDKVKAGQPLYGTSTVTPYLQGVAARNSRYSELFIHVLPWFNLVNHDQVCRAVKASLGISIYVADYLN